MKKMLFLVLVVSVFVVNSAWADYLVGSADITRVNGYYGGRGGEFTLYNVNLTTAGYSSATSNVLSSLGSSFQTFCLETDEYVLPPTHVEQVWVNESGLTGSQAVYGGANSTTADPLDYRTAYLYTQFATDQLSGYAYTGTVGGLTRSQTAAALQRVIWAIEDEGGSDFAVNFMDTPLNSDQQVLANQWMTEAGAAGWTSIGNVRVLNLWSNTALTARQDMLYLVPVPGAALLGFLGFGWAGLKLRKRV
ncbi:hypothetical protein [Anaerobaca lacustris]|uniref:Thioester domain-containing protein n=1 Tax=Anaerobaca lacustris TaxID=3044600 RepID=A0AAW6U1E8_9BACT|nr:hypothetical protein [Sedimentisphaerales bacterium M17dextr]